MIVRSATRADAAAMAELINAIIAIGGTTAYEDTFDAAGMDAEYVSPPYRISCFVAEADGEVVGFQGLLRSFEAHDPFPDDWGIIGTFARVGLRQSGVGAALFARTVEAARDAGVRTIDATIRADNAAGLAFYSRLGFVDYARLVGKPLKDGRPVDRIRKRFEVV